MGRRKTNLIVVQGKLNAQGYINQILQPEAVPFLQRHGPAILMHDNARPHVSRIFRQFLNRNNVNVLPWPAVSPDMNPIEHIWDYLGKKVRARGNSSVYMGILGQAFYPILPHFYPPRTTFSKAGPLFKIS